MMELILLLQADVDIQAAFDRYEEYQTGRGELFMRQFKTTKCGIREDKEA
ncbi:MAG: hypothetical protein O2960_28785 [Verrucomicrobia bacterium]|nr:hypothetical protein [Verrucomicrobiota bacterium]